MKLSIFTTILLSLVTTSSFSVEPWLSRSIHLEDALKVWRQEKRSVPARLGVHDVSFFGHKILLKDYLSQSVDSPPLMLVSPHGSSVSQLIVSKRDGIHPDQKINSLTVGIFEEDFEEAVQTWQRKSIKIINLSLGMRSAEVVGHLNAFIDDGGIVIASAGNSRERLGEHPKDYYKNFKGILVGASDGQGKPTSFSQFLPGKTIWAPGEISSLRTQKILYKISPRLEPTELDDNLKVQDHHFGMTSGAAPIVTGIVLLALQINPNLTQAQINHLLVKSSTAPHGVPFLHAANFLKLVRDNR